MGLVLLISLLDTTVLFIEVAHPDSEIIQIPIAEIFISVMQR